MVSTQTNQAQIAKSCERASTFGRYSHVGSMGNRMGIMPTCGSSPDLFESKRLFTCHSNSRPAKSFPTPQSRLPPAPPPQPAFLEVRLRGDMAVPAELAPVASLPPWCNLRAQPDTEGTVAVRGMRCVWGGERENGGANHLIRTTAGDNWLVQNGTGHHT